MKIPPYNLGSVSLEAEQFRDDVTNAINLGKIAPAVTTSPPGWKAQPAEMVFQMPQSGGTTLYFYRNSAWVALISISV